jgi:hypothetical protein
MECLMQKVDKIIEEITPSPEDSFSLKKKVSADEATIEQIVTPQVREVCKIAKIVHGQYTINSEQLHQIT